MPCYTTVLTEIRDLALATEAAKKLGWTVETNPDPNLAPAQLPRQT